MISLFYLFLINNAKMNLPNIGLIGLGGSNKRGWLDMNGRLHRRNRINAGILRSSATTPSTPWLLRVSLTRRCHLLKQIQKIAISSFLLQKESKQYVPNQIRIQLVLKTKRVIFILFFIRIRPQAAILNFRNILPAQYFIILYFRL